VRPGVYPSRDPDAAGMWAVLTSGGRVEYFEDRVEALNHANRLVREARVLEQAEAELRAFEQRIAYL
jgi:hypothetical protein